MDKLIIRRDMINAKRYYPGLHVYIGKNEGLLGGITLPRHVYFVKFKHDYGLYFTRFKKEMLNKIFDSRLNNCEIVFESYCAGVYARHNLEGDLFPIINKLCPKVHYQNHIQKQINEDENGCVEIWGEDFFEFVNRAACFYVARRYFLYSIDSIISDDISSFGDDMVAMFSDLADLASSARDTVLDCTLSEYNNIFGSDLVGFAFNQCRSVYMTMRTRFDERRFAKHLLNEDDEFLFSYG